MTAVPDSPSSTGSLPVPGGATSAADYAAAHAVAHAERPTAHGGRSAKGGHAWDMLTTTDHKKLGIMYIVMSFLFFFAAGLMALFMRVELFHPGMQYLSNEQFNQMFTIHGTLMLLLFGTPIVWGFANAILPLQIGAPDVAFPRLNAFGFWITLFGGLMVLAGFLTPGGAADFGWTMYMPLADAIHSPGVGTNLWIVGVGLTGVGTIASAVNMITTILCLRAPGMTMFRMPIFTWNVLVTSLLALLIFPMLTAAALGVLYDRLFGGHIYDPANGGGILWQHLFWFFGHPEVYVLALPFFGIVSEIFPVFSRKPMFGYVGLVFATLSIAALSLAVWAHHMFVTGAVLLPFFSFMTFLIAVPTGVKFFNWL
ncbi:MAG: cbb3-type cytochrome c oxidase subunit I, partial [Corynebacterium variabile]|uniref:cbb3-type cytochrome c oxidase subunit I n=1 Tax=Corynebacterium variabile TaxID=1727 RepID=UPI003F8FF393